jgi:hypothetical protein
LNNLIKIRSLPVQSVPITTKVVSSNLVYGEVYSIQHYVIKFVRDLRQIGGFLRLLRFHPPIKLYFLLRKQRATAYLSEYMHVEATLLDIK